MCLVSQSEARARRRAGRLGTSSALRITWLNAIRLLSSIGLTVDAADSAFDLSIALIQDIHTKHIFVVEIRHGFTL